ncbi:MAG: YcxB family protein [Lachnospiraceae bacterium]|nr:YcxB family protein [Lachnospiraceae bacterium]
MSEAFAENEMTLTKTLFYEGMQAIQKESYGKSINKLILVLIGVWIVLSTVTVKMSGSLAYSLVELVVLGLIVFWMGVYLPRNKAKRAFAKLQEKYGEDLSRKTLFFEDHFTVEASGYETEFRYEEIEKIYETKHLLVLVDENKTGVMVDLGGFIKGSKEDVLRRLEKTS